MIQADDYRKMKGQSRWYHDPLPGCDIADEDPNWEGPAVSVVKNAAGKDWTFVSMQRAGAAMAHHGPERLVEMAGDPADVWADRLRQYSEAGLDSASSRGTAIHRAFEVYDESDGDLDSALAELETYGHDYRGVVRRILQRERPKMRLSEFVCISRSIGYGGTGDSIWEIDGELWMVDYKSRDSDSEPGAYIEEAWQGAAYSYADYWIVEQHGEPVRIPPFPVAGVLIISLNRRDYRMIRTSNMEQAWAGFLALHELWRIKHAGKQAVFGRKSPSWLPTPPTVDRWVRDRISDLVERPNGRAALVQWWPSEIPTPKKHAAPYTDAQVDVIVPMLERAEAQVSAPWPETDPRVASSRRHPSNQTPEPAPEPTPEPAPSSVPFEPEMPDEGEVMQKSAADVVFARFSALPANAADWINERVGEARSAVLPIDINTDRPTRRRIMIGRALVLGCERRLTLQLFTALLAECEPAAMLSSVPLGARLGALDHHQAAKLAQLVSTADSASPAWELPPGPPVNEDELWHSLKVPQLQAECRNRGLSPKGKKADLVSRIIEHDQSNRAGQGPDRTGEEQ